MIFFPFQKYLSQLKKEKAKLEAALNSINVGFIITDQKGEIETINTAAKVLLCSDYPNIKNAMTDPNLINLKCDMNLVSSNLKDCFDIRTQVKKCLEERKSFSANNLSFKNLFLHIYLTPIVLVNKKPKIRLEFIGAVILVEDVTEGNILERSKKDFFSIATHELKTPLAVIRGNTEIIKKHYNHENERFNKILDDIYDSSLQLINIVNDFLDISRFEQGKIEFKKEVFDVKTLIKEIIQNLKQLAQDKGLYIKFNSAAKIPRVGADQNKVKQVLLNLLDNSIKFTSQGGITIDLKVEENMAKIIIKDTGQGISTQNQRLIFRKFQLASDDILTRATSKSTGVGLYIAKFMVEGMGGQIKLEYSQIGKGSIFDFTLPLANIV
ncbi:HAMP domain-containing histidine kinase [Candidatus Daviesbacteria bacterium]|nr:HAMP domain-containing histidine kinase [Candidatus Daviesbacteria bacterium]